MLTRKITGVPFATNCLFRVVKLTLSRRIASRRRRSFKMATIAQAQREDNSNFYDVQRKSSSIT